VEWSGRHLTPAGSRGKAETPQAKLRRLSFLPGYSCVWSAMERTFSKESSLYYSPNLLVKYPFKRGHSGIVHLNRGTIPE